MPPVLIPPMCDTHLPLPNTGSSTYAQELQDYLEGEDARRYEDMFYPIVVTGGLFEVPNPGSLTIDPFGTLAYGSNGCYIVQADASITLSGGDGEYWIAAHASTSAAVAGWTRQLGTHYLWQFSPTRPLTPYGGVLLAQVTVAGGVITEVDDIRNLDPNTNPDASGLDPNQVANLYVLVATQGQTVFVFDQAALLASNGNQSATVTLDEGLDAGDLAMLDANGGVGFYRIYVNGVVQEPDALTLLMTEL